MYSSCHNRVTSSSIINNRIRAPVFTLTISWIKSLKEKNLWFLCLQLPLSGPVQYSDVHSSRFCAQFPVQMKERMIHERLAKLVKLLYARPNRRPDEPSVRGMAWQAPSLLTLAPLSLPQFNYKANSRRIPASQLAWIKTSNDSSCLGLSNMWKHVSHGSRSAEDVTNFPCIIVSRVRVVNDGTFLSIADEIPHLLPYPDKLTLANVMICQVVIDLQTEDQRHGHPGLRLSTERNASIDSLSSIFTLPFNRGRAPLKFSANASFVTMLNFTSSLDILIPARSLPSFSVPLWMALLMGYWGYNP